MVKSDGFVVSDQSDDDCVEEPQATKAEIEKKEV